MMAVLRLMLPFEIPPTMRASIKIRKLLDIAHNTYDNATPIYNQQAQHIISKVNRLSML